MNYEKDIEIDDRALDMEWLDQPKRMHRVCKEAAEARRAMDLAKEALDVERARADKEIRSDPEKFDISKITEAVVNATVLDHPDVRRATKDYINARYDYEVLQGAVRAFDQRKTALENLVRLHGQSYFAGPNVPRDLSLERAKAEKNQASNVKVARRTRTRR